MIDNTKKILHIGKLSIWWWKEWAFRAIQFRDYFNENPKWLSIDFLNLEIRYGLEK